MKMPIIALGRQFGSGGREIGKQLAEKLQVRCYDRELITLAAQKAEEKAKAPKAPAPEKEKARPAAPKKLKFSYKEQREFETIDGDIAALEGQIAQVQAEQAAKATDYVALQELQGKQAELEAALEEKMDRWVYLNDLAERIVAQEN